jgi:hypothetical protein
MRLCHSAFDGVRFLTRRAGSPRPSRERVRPGPAHGRVLQRSRARTGETKIRPVKTNRPGDKVEQPDELPKLELTEFQAKISELVEKQPAPVRHSARMAIHHLKRAWRIKKIDPEMAYLRALTAEEEAATAVFRSMKRLKYKGAEQLKDRNHTHKNALVPFAYAVGKVLQLTVKEAFDPKLVIKEEGPEAGKLQVRFTLNVNGSEVHAWPKPPLHYGISVNNETHDFSDELAALATEAKAQDALGYVKHMANRRNQVLYAHPTGIPVTQEDDGFLEKRRQNVFMLLTIYLLIDQYEEHQLFVQQAIDALLKLLKIVEKPDPEGEALAA